MVEGIRPEGHLVIRIYDKDRNFKREYKSCNQITNAGYDLAFTRGFGNLFRTGGDVFGQLYTIDEFTGFSGGVRYNTLENPIHLGLLKLDTKRNSLNMASSVANFYSDNFDSLDNVLGYAGNQVNSVGSKEGKIILSSGQSVAAGYTRSLSWEFPVNVGGGTFDTAVLTSRATLTTPYPSQSGICTYKCIDKANVFAAGFISLSTGLCPPGVPGMTEENEVLLNYNDGSGEKWKYNLDTGETVLIKDSEPFMVPIKNSTLDWFTEGDYLYELSYTGSSYIVTIWQISTGSEVDTFSVSVLSGTYIDKMAFLKYNDNMYITANSLDSRSSGSRLCWTLNKSGEYYTSVTNGTSILDTIGITLPSGLDVRQVALGNYGSQYIVYLGFTGIIVNDLTSIVSSMTDVVPYLYNGIVPYKSGFIGIGAPGALSGSSWYDNENVLNISDSAWLVGGTSTSDTVSLYKQGAMLMTNKHWGTMTSYFVFSSPVIKSDDEIMTARWTYNFSSNTSNGTITGGN